MNTKKPVTGPRLTTDDQTGMNTSSDANLGSAQFLESAWQQVQATQLETDGATPALTLDDYDALKNLIFEKLGGGELIQIFDTNNNRVVLQKQHVKLGTR